MTALSRAQVHMRLAQISPGPTLDSMSPDEPSSEPLDVERLIADLPRLGQEHQQVVNRRPKADALRDSLSQFASILSEWTDHSRRMAALMRGIDPDHDYGLYPLTSALAQADFDHWQAQVVRFCERPGLVASYWLDTNPDRNPVSWGLDFLARCFNTIYDDFAGIAVLIGTESHIRAPITLARSVLEAAAIGCHIVDSAVSPTERLRRVLNLHFDQLKETCNADDGGDDGQSGASVELRELIRFAEEIGFTVRYRPDRWTAPVILGDGQKQPDSSRKIVEAVLPGVGTDMWRSLSAVAHSRDSLTLLPDEYSPGHMVKPWQRTESVAWHTLAPMFLVRELCVRIEDYLGWEFADLISLLDEILKQWSVGGGMFDEQIRANLGLD